MAQSSTHRTLTALALTALVAACGPSTAPEVPVPFDTEAALADYEAVGTLLSSSDLASLRALGGRTPFSGASPSSQQGVRGESGPQAAPLISATYRGSTFVYNGADDRWVLDADRLGAPATGVRFVLYEVDETGTPIVAEEIGHADLIDEGDASVEDVVLRLVVVTRGVTRLDYRTTVEVGLTFGEVTVLGFLIGDANAQLDFDIEVDATKTLSQSTLDIAFDLAVASRDFTISGSVSGIEEGSDEIGEVALAVQHGSHTLEVDATGSAGQIDGTVRLNGDLFATITGDAENPTIVSADGDPLTLGEQLVLLGVLDTIEDVFDFLEDLVEPAGELVVLGFILS
jgi:hypothetical protein